MEFIYAIAGILIGMLIIYLWKMNDSNKMITLNDRLQSAISEKQQLNLSNQDLHQKHQMLLSEKGRLTGQLEHTQTEAQQYRKLYQEESNELANTRELHSSAKNKLENVEEKLAIQKGQLQELGDQFKNEFRLLANGIMEEKSRKFTELNEANMKGLLDPLQLNLKEFKEKIEDTYNKESKERFSLEKELRVLVELNKQLGAEANNLTHALKYNNKVQGNWGEMILESLLEHSGLTRDREYFIQEFLRDQSGALIKDEEGRALQPDVIIVYPDQRKVIVDSKMSLVAFEQYVAAENPDEQELALREHIRSIRQHIDGLSKKNYPRYAGSALDHVILFIPVEPAFLLAVKEDQQLWKYAYDRRILLVSPTNFLAVLKIIADLWKVEKQSQHAIEIAEKAGGLYDKFVLFVESMESIGLNLQKASEAHTNAMKRLSEGNGNLVKQAEQLKKMGAKANKQLPEGLLKKDGAEEISLT